MQEERGVVLDASALLAYLNEETGRDAVAPVVPKAIISTVNWVEVVQKLLARGIVYVPVKDALVGAGLEILPFTASEAEVAAELEAQTKPLGLSLGDRACLALARRLGVPVLTTDRIWGQLTLPVTVQVIR
ncbi:MAG: type II toxin-antitoxin system VapC family toxin [Chloroflexi bacterium]|nr:type II toxin-antitoxin system VapC family toxin [Chloroflexota bacterium]